MKNMMFFLPALLFMVFSCNNSDKLTHFVKNDTERIDEAHPGKKLLEKHCYVCHSPKKDHNNRVAPPIMVVKKHYLDTNTSKEEFIEDIQSWIENPNETNAKMPGAIRRFGIMPKMNYNKDDIEQIADFLYTNNNLENQGFHMHHRQRSKKKNKASRN